MEKCEQGNILQRRLARCGKDYSIVLGWSRDWCAIDSGGKRARYSGREDSAGLVGAWFASESETRAHARRTKRDCALRLELR
jgi:hypothetical protein